MKKREKKENPTADNKIHCRQFKQNRIFYQACISVVCEIVGKAGRAVSGQSSLLLGLHCSAMPVVEKLEVMDRNYGNRGLWPWASVVTAGTLPFPLWLMLFSGPRCFHCDLYQEMNALCSTFLSHVQVQIRVNTCDGFPKTHQEPQCMDVWEMQILVLCSLQYREALKKYIIVEQTNLPYPLPPILPCFEQYAQL